MSTTVTPVNSIQIPAEFVELCEHWHGGQNCMLYAVSSTGNLITGSLMPQDCETDEQWYIHIWQALSADLSATLRQARKRTDDADIEAMSPTHEKYADYVAATLERLVTEYGEEEWFETH